MPSNEARRIVLVTGANRGIGFEIVKKLAETSADEDELILLGCRHMKRGEEAWIRLNSPSHVHLLELDVSSAESIFRARQVLIDQYGGHVDVLINNAAIGELDLTLNTAREMFSTNYYGIQRLNECLYPLIRNHGRVINVASQAGAMLLSEMSKDLQEQYMASDLTKAKLDQLVQAFIAHVENGRFESLGYNPKSPYLLYSATKAAVLALTRIEARQYAADRNILVVAVCPGFCRTDLNKNAPGGRPAAFGADSILHVVNTPVDGLIHGGFYHDGRLLPMIATENRSS